MLRSSTKLAAAGCRAGRGVRDSLASSPLASQQPMAKRGQLLGLCRTRGLSHPALRQQQHLSVSHSSSMATFCGRHRSVVCGASVSRGVLLADSGRRPAAREAAPGRIINPSMIVRGVQTGPFSGPFTPGSKPPAKPSDPSDGKKKPTLMNRYIAPPDDGLTRYPTLRSPQGMLRGMDYMGTAVFALSGTVTAGQVGMDLMGCVIVGTITATGGGTVRDLLLGNTPVFWMHETEYLWICLLTSLGVFFLWSYLAKIGEPCITLLGRNVLRAWEDRPEAARYALMLRAEDLPLGKPTELPMSQIIGFCKENGVGLELIPLGRGLQPPSRNKPEFDFDCSPEEGRGKGHPGAAAPSPPSPGDESLFTPQELARIKSQFEKSLESDEEA